MGEIIQLLISVLIFAGVGYLGFWICDKAGFPPPVRWIFGGLMLIVLLLYISGGFVSAPALRFGR